VVSVLDSGAERFKSQSRSTLSGNSWQTVHTHCASVHQAAKLVAALLKVAGVNAGLAESNGSLPPGLWLTSPAACRLTAKSRDQLRNPTFGNRVWATFFYFLMHQKRLCLVAGLYPNLSGRQENAPPMSSTIGFVGATASATSRSSRHIRRLSIAHRALIFSVHGLLFAGPDTAACRRSIHRPAGVTRT